MKPPAISYRNPDGRPLNCVAFPITAYFGRMRVDFESPASARRWLGTQLGHVPEQDHYGYFTKEESALDLGAFDSMHLLDEAQECRACGARADLEHIEHGPMCCGCCDEFYHQDTKTPRTPNL